MTKQKESKWAIVIDKIGGEFYPDPIYTDIPKLDAKLKYLADYREKHNMKCVGYIAELLTPERETQHNDEWTRWVASID
jgi:hypothetical protein